jgi:hypothetical protein
MRGECGGVAGTDLAWKSVSQEHGKDGQTSLLSPVVGKLEADDLSNHQSVLQRQTMVGFVDSTLE